MFNFIIDYQLNRCHWGLFAQPFSFLLLPYRNLNFGFGNVLTLFHRFIFAEAALGLHLFPRAWSYNSLGLPNAKAAPLQAGLIKVPGMGGLEGDIFHCPISNFRL